MKQKIQITGKNLNEIFALPCVFKIQKSYIMGEQGEPIPSQKLEDSFVEVAFNPLLDSCSTWARVGDWIVEDGNGNWHVEKGDEK